MNLLERIDQVLKGSQFRRDDLSTVDHALHTLTTYKCQPLRDFFAHYRGPVGSSVIGYQLLDIVEDKPSILTATEAIREQFRLDPQFLVISDILANGILLYDADKDHVYDVDFEGGFDLFVNGNLPPRWTSFRKFLVEFFALD